VLFEQILDLLPNGAIGEKAARNATDPHAEGKAFPEGSDVFEYHCRFPDRLVKVMGSLRPRRLVKSLIPIKETRAR
jgi:hypothetical protein